MKFLFHNLPLRSIVIIGFLIPLICTVLVAWLQWQSTSEMMNARLVGRQIRAVQIAAGIFRYSLSDAESCQFRYILTHNETNVDLYQNLVAQAQAQFAVMRSATPSGAYQVRYLDDIEPLLHEKLRITDQSMTMEKNGDHAGALQIVSAESARTNMLQIEKDIEQIQVIQMNLIAQLQNSYQHNLKLNALLSAGSMVLCLGFMFSVLMLLRHLARLQSSVTLTALSEMINYEDGKITIEEYLKRRRNALQTHGPAQVEAERILGLLEKRKQKVATTI